MKIKAYFDGACEPVNPGGYASYGAVIYQDYDEIATCSRLFKPKKGHERETSNNVAEYSGFLWILQYLIGKRLQKEEIIVYGDSKLVIEQMFGRWKMHGGFYIPVAKRAKKLLRNFSNIKGVWIPREQNYVADKLSKAELIKAGVEFRIQPEL